MLNIKHRGFFYHILLWFTLLVSLSILIYLSPLLVRPENIIVDDFSQFWAAGKLNITGGNPYNPGEITKTIQDIGGKVSNGDVVSIMLNPPWTLTLITPFSLIDYTISRLIWLLLNVALVLTSMRLLWVIYEGQPKHKKRALLLIFLFSPALAALQKGQFTPFILFGIVAALHNIKIRDDPWMAGMFLAMASFKPQLIYLLWIALLLWTVVNKKWQLLISTISTIAMLTTISLMINPNVLSQYLVSIRAYPFSEWATPTIGSLLRLILGLDKFWLQFIPMALGTVIFTYYWLMEKESWNWIDGSPVIVGFSMLTTPYAWTYDAILFIIPIVHASIYAINHYSKKILLVIFSVLLIISLFNLILHMQLNDFWFVWLFPSIFLWCEVTKKFHEISL